MKDSFWVSLGYRAPRLRSGLRNLQVHPCPAVRQTTVTYGLNSRAARHHHRPPRARARARPRLPSQRNASDEKCQLVSKPQNHNNLRNGVVISLARGRVAFSLLQRWYAFLNACDDFFFSAGLPEGNRRQDQCRHGRV